MQPGKTASRTQEHGTSTILRFRHGQADLGVSRSGGIRPGQHLVVEFDPRRIISGEDNPVLTTALLCHARFQPVAHIGSASLVEGPAGTTAVANRRAVCEFVVPSGTTSVELWFERRRADGGSDWDSRYGQNYVFDVVSDGLPIPKQSLAIRDEAIVDVGTIRVVHDTATKEQVGMGASGRRLRTLLTVRALVEPGDDAADAWADVQVFDATGDLIQAGSLAIDPPPGDDNPAARVWDDEVYQGSGGGSGMGAWSRPNAHMVQYRLYSRVGRHVFTDGLLHEFDVPADEDVSHSP